MQRKITLLLCLSFTLATFNFGQELPTINAFLHYDYFKDKKVLEQFKKAFNEGNQSLKAESNQAPFAFTEVAEEDSSSSYLEILYFPDRYDLSWHSAQNPLNGYYSKNISTKVSFSSLRAFIHSFLLAIYELEYDVSKKLNSPVLSFKEKISIDALKKSSGSNYASGFSHVQKDDSGYTILFGSSELIKTNKNLLPIDLRNTTLEFSLILGQYNSKITLAGNILTSTGGKIYKFAMGGVRPEIIAENASDATVVGNFNDGVPLLYSASKNKFQVISNGNLINLELEDYPQFASSFASVEIDHNNIINILDNSRNMILRYLENGKLKDITILHANSKNTEYNTYAGSNFRVLPDGKFLFYGYTSKIAIFDNNGLYIESFEPLDPLGNVNATNLIVEKISNSGEYAIFSQTDQLLTFWNFNQRSIDDKTLYNWQKEVENLKETLEDRVKFYKDQKNDVLLFESLNDLTSILSAPEKALLKNDITKLNNSLISNSVKIYELKVRDLLKQFGQFTASMPYSDVMKSYEKLMYEQPENKEIREASKNLAEAFKNADILNQKSVEIEFVSKDIDPLFPALISRYQKKPIGIVRIKNTSKNTLENVYVSLNFKRFMDFPTDGSKTLALLPNQEIDLPISVSLTPDVLDLQEDLSLQGEIKINYTLNKDAKSMSIFSPFKMYKKSSLVWDHSEKLASFVTPNDQAITDFAHLSLVGQKAYIKSGLPPKVQTAMSLINALAEYKLAYIEDPQNPISKTLGQEEVVDTVRFPRHTMLLKSGDCDDTTALILSLFESVNIETAIMTSPGHVFLAFNTEEPQDRAYLWSIGNSKPLIKNGTVWLAIESTLTEKGFFACWKAASELVSSLKADQIEFIPLASIRKEFPPVPLAGQTSNIEIPQAQKIRDNDINELNKLFTLIAKPFIDKAIIQSQDKLESIAIKSYNQIGLAYAIFGKLDDALNWYESGLKKFPKSQALYANYAVLLYNKNKFTDAIAILEKSLSIEPQNSKINYLLARVCIAAEQKSQGQKYFDLALKNGGKELVNDIAFYYGGDGKDKDRAGLIVNSRLPWFE